MIVICEECGKKYRVNPEQIKGSAARFKCKACNHLVLVLPPEDKPAQPVPGPEGSTSAAAPPKKDPAADSMSDTISDLKVSASDTYKIRGLGLRGKMILLFFVIPIAIIALSGILYLRQLNELSYLITEESAKIVETMAEDIIADQARSVASQCRLFIEGHPNLAKTDYNKDAAFKPIAVQKVGKTGYTALYETPDAAGVWRTWAHVNPKIIGIDMSTLEKPLGENFPGFWKVYTGVKGGKESKGYYTWRDESGQFRNKFMVCSPVAGTPYIVAATTYLDEFTEPVDIIKKNALRITGNTRIVIIAIIVATIVLIGLIVSMYGYAMTRKLKSLTDIADRISIGDLDVSIDIDSRDEIGALAKAIGRMQESIRLSIERLRKRRSL